MAEEDKSPGNDQPVGDQDQGQSAAQCSDPALGWLSGAMPQGQVHVRIIWLC